MKDGYVAILFGVFLLDSALLILLFCGDGIS